MLKRVQIYAVLEEVAEQFGLLAEHLMSLRERRDIVIARDVAAWACLKIGGYAPAVTAKVLGRRAENEIIAGAHWVEVKRHADPDMRAATDQIAKALTEAEAALNKLKITPHQQADIFDEAERITRSPSLALMASAETIRGLARFAACSVLAAAEPKPKTEAEGETTHG